MAAVAELDGVTKVYGSGAAHMQALVDITLAFEPGEFVSIMGPSGCGKTTLLNLIAGFDVPTSGRVKVMGQDLATLSETARSKVRARHLGFVVQSFDLLPRLTIEENVRMRLGPLGVYGGVARQRSRSMLEEVGIHEPMWARYPGELSGGEQQRVAIARALVAQPTLVLADEPTGNLDSTTGAMVLDLLRRLNTQRDTSVVMVTHDHFAAGYGHRTLELADGRVVLEVGLPKRSHPREMTVVSLRED